MKNVGVSDRNYQNLKRKISRNPRSVEDTLEKQEDINRKFLDMLMTLSETERAFSRRLERVEKWLSDAHIAGASMEEIADDQN